MQSDNIKAILDRYIGTNIRSNGTWQFDRLFVLKEIKSVETKCRKIRDDFMTRYGIDLNKGSDMIEFLNNKLRKYRDKVRYVSDDEGVIRWNLPQVYYLLLIYMDKTSMAKDVEKLMRYYGWSVYLKQLRLIVSSGMAVGDVLNVNTKLGMSLTTMEGRKNPLILTTGVQKLRVGFGEYYYVSVKNIIGLATAMYCNEWSSEEAFKKYKGSDILHNVHVNRVELIIPYLLTQSMFNMDGGLKDEFAKRCGKCDTEVTVYTRDIQKEKFKLLNELELSNKKLFADCKLECVLREGLIYSDATGSLGKYFKKLKECPSLKSVIVSGFEW